GIFTYMFVFSRNTLIVNILQRIAITTYCGFFDIILFFIMPKQHTFARLVLFPSIGIAVSKNMLLYHLPFLSFGEFRRNKDGHFYLILRLGGPVHYNPNLPQCLCSQCYSEFIFLPLLYHFHHRFCFIHYSSVYSSLGWSSSCSSSVNCTIFFSSFCNRDRRRIYEYW
ncbi:hypothetical protein L9F63_018299, partial [Diploptera punctata]